MAAEQHVHQLVAQLDIGEPASRGVRVVRLVLGLDQHRKDVLAAVPVEAPATDLGRDDLVEVGARRLHSRPRRAGSPQQHRPNLGVRVGKRALEQDCSLLADARLAWVESDQRAHSDGHCESPDPLVHVDRVTLLPVGEGAFRLVEHHRDGSVHPPAMERRHHDPPRPVVVLAVGGDQAVADQRRQVLAEHPLAVAEVLGAPYGDEVVRLRSDQAHEPAVKATDREHRAVALVEVEQSPQRVTLEPVRAG